MILGITRAVQVYHVCDALCDFFNSFSRKEGSGRGSCNSISGKRGVRWLKNQSKMDPQHHPFSLTASVSPSSSSLSSPPSSSSLSSQPSPHPPPTPPHPPPPPLSHSP
ncbi:hypothetical protein RYX36_006057 [Vicia faba]